MQRNMTAKDYYNRGYAYREKGQLDLVIANYSKAIELNPNFAQAKKSLEILLKKPTKSELFNAIKKLPIEIQIPLLKQCLDKNTILGKRFWQEEGFYEKIFGC